MSSVAVVAMHKLKQQELGRMFEEHYDLVYRTAYGITRSVEDAEDVVQMIFLQLLKRDTPLDLSANCRGYFYRAALKTSFSVLRSRQRHNLTEFHETDSTTESRHGYEEALDAQLWEAIDSLSDNMKEMIVLRYVHQLDLTHIAKVLGTTRSTVAVTLFRARARLKQLMRAVQQEQRHET
jgi:RNA polymerase sigma-70 factor (ECF subfamily)